MISKVYSISTYDGLWRESMAELNEQLHVEGVDDAEEQEVQVHLI